MKYMCEIHTHENKKYFPFNQNSNNFPYLKAWEIVRI